MTGDFKQSVKCFKGMKKDTTEKERLGKSQVEKMNDTLFGILGSF